jgi:hypothetical protein
VFFDQGNQTSDFNGKAAAGYLLLLSRWVQAVFGRGAGFAARI